MEWEPYSLIWINGKIILHDVNNQMILVDGLEHELYFSMGRTIPTDCHILQRGGSTTNQDLVYVISKKNDVNHDDV